MLKNVHVPRSIVASFMLSCIVLLAFVPMALAHSSDQHDAGIRYPQHYLALGDSLAYGYQPNGDNTNGYVDDFFTFLQSHGVQDHQNLGCPGETTDTFINGGKCTYPSPFSSQLDAAVAYLQQQVQAGQTTLVTLDIGANDLLPDINPETCQVSDTFKQDLQTLDTNLTGTILPQLHAALKGNHRQVSGNLVLLNYYDAYQNTCPNTAQDIQRLNKHLAHDVAGFGSLVDIFNAFGGSTVPNPNICNDTWMCNSTSDPNIHPTSAGYQVIACALEKIYSNTNHNGSQRPASSSPSIADFLRWF
jgi:lysophospholipase L1-like esterase